MSTWELAERRTARCWTFSLVDSDERTGVWKVEQLVEHTGAPMWCLLVELRDSSVSISVLEGKRH